MESRVEDIEYLRAVMSIFVVIWHMNGGGQSLIFSKESYTQHDFTASDFVNFHLLLLAVPTFVFISIYLYASKPVSASGLKKQSLRILILLSFWPIALIIFRNGNEGVVAVAPRSLFDIIHVTLCAGYTVYYFFTSLIVCLLITHLFLHLNSILQLSIFAISVALLTALPQITKLTGLYPLSAYWNPFNFIPLSLGAALFARNKDYVLKNKGKIQLLSVVLCASLSIFEWKYSVGQIFFPGQGYAIPAYTRISLTFAVFAVFVLALNPKIKANGPIKYMARYSLALYCLHPFLIDPVKRFVAIFNHNEAVSLYVSIGIVVALSYSIAPFLRRYYLREEVIL